MKRGRFAEKTAKRRSKVSHQTRLRSKLARNQDIDGKEIDVDLHVDDYNDDNDGNFMGSPKLDVIDITQGEHLKSRVFDTFQDEEMEEIHGEEMNQEID